MANILPELCLAYFGERAIIVSTAFDGVSSLVSFLAAPLLGALSDYYGRRVALALSLAALSLPFIPLIFTSNLWIHMCLRPIAGEYLHTFDRRTACVSRIGQPHF